LKELTLSSSTKLQELEDMVYVLKLNNLFMAQENINLKRANEEFWKETSKLKADLIRSEVGMQQDQRRREEPSISSQSISGKYPYTPYSPVHKVLH